MNNNTQKSKDRFEHYDSALKSIQHVIPNFSTLSKLDKDGLIRRLNVAFALAFNLMKEYMELTGYPDIDDPQTCLNQMAADNILDGMLWQKALETISNLRDVDYYDNRYNYLDIMVKEYMPIFESLKEIRI